MVVMIDLVGDVTPAPKRPDEGFHLERRARLGYDLDEILRDGAEITGAVGHDHQAGA
jgi:hypothetical protein